MDDAHIFFEEVILGKQPSIDDFRRFVSILWESYSEEIFLFAYAKLESLEDARDVCQDVFVKAMEWLERKPRQVPTKVNFPAWLRRIARNLIIDRFRRPALELQWQHTGCGSEKRLSSFDDWPELHTCNPAEDVNKEEELEILNRCVDMLPEQKKRVVKLCDIEELPYKTVSERLGIPSSTVGVLLHRARKELRECVELQLAV